MYLLHLESLYYQPEPPSLEQQPGSQQFLAEKEALALNLQV